jgi:hypothetical protein
MAAAAIAQACNQHHAYAAFEVFSTAHTWLTALIHCSDPRMLHCVHHVAEPSIMTDVSTAAASAAAAVEAVDTAAVETSSTACAALLVWVKAAAKSAEVAAAKRAEDEV